MTPSEKRAAEQVVEAARQLANHAEQAVVWARADEDSPCEAGDSWSHDALQLIAALRAALAAWDAESGGERPGNGVEGLREPSMPALAHGVSGRSPALIGDVSDGCGVDGHAGYTAAQLSGTAAASAEGWSSAPSGQATAEQAPKLARAGIKPGHPSDTSPPDPAAVPPATSPASDVHAGGGAPAEEPLPEWSRGYRLVCPRCERIREAVVEKYAGEPWPRYVHECACGYVICESEWNEAPASEELLEQPTGLLDDLAKQMGVETPEQVTERLRLAAFLEKELSK